MRRYREQRLGQLADILNEEVLNILACKYHCGFLFADALLKVADIFHSGQVSQKQIKFIDACNCISAAQKLLGHIRENVEQQSIADILARLKQSFYAKRDKAAVGDVGVSVKELTLRALADRVQSEADILQVFGGVEIFH